MEQILDCKYRDCESKAHITNEGYCKEHLIQIKEECFLDNTNLEDLGIVRWARFFLPHYMPQNTAEFHKQMYKAMLTLYDPFYKNKLERLLEIISYRGSAKAQDLDSKILTPNGWITLRNLKEGSFIIGSDGKRTKVIKLHPIRKEQLYKVKTRDNRETICNGEHLWKVRDTRMGKTYKIYETSKMLKTYKYNHFDSRTNKTYVTSSFFLDTVKPVKFNKKDLPIDPYFLGLWLGDGHSNDTRLTGLKEDLKHYMKHFDKIKYVYSSFRDNKYSRAKTINVSNMPIKSGNRGKDCLRKKLRDLNLINNKHIPNIYLFNSIKDRIALLQGLIDTDGTIDRTGIQFSFTSARKELAYNFLELIRGLGGTGTLKYNEWNGFNSYRINCRVPKDIIPCNLPRKTQRWKGSIKTRNAITEIKKVGIKECRCITIENPNGLYVTDDYMLTHNSTIITMLLICYLLANNGREMKLKFRGEIVKCIINESFIVIISETGQMGEDFAVRVRDEFTVNPRLIYFYKSKIQTAYDAIDGQWTRRAFKFNNCFVLGIGTRMQIRGRIKGASRITLLIADDIYSEETVKTETTRHNIRTWWNKAVKNSVDDLRGKIILMGTIVHEDTVLIDCERSEIWETLKFFLMPVRKFKKFVKEHIKVDRNSGEVKLPFDEIENKHERLTQQRRYFNKVQYSYDWELSWKERIDLYFIALKYKEEATSDKATSINSFYQEYFHIVIPDEAKRFRQEMFLSAGEHRIFRKFGLMWILWKDLHEQPQRINIQFGVDLSGGGLTGDDAVISIGGRLPDESTIVLKQVVGKFSLRDDLYDKRGSQLDSISFDRDDILQIGIIDECYRQSFYYHPEYIRVGQAGEEKAIVREFRRLFETMDNHTQILPRKQIANYGAKKERIKNGMLHRYEALSVYHAGNLEKLEYQLEFLDSTAKDDEADALECMFYGLEAPGWDEYEDYKSSELIIEHPVNKVLWERHLNNSKRNWTDPDYI